MQVLLGLTLTQEELRTAFEELEQMGFIGGRRPRMYAVQPEGCAPIVKAWEQGEEHAPLWENAHTVAAGIRVPIAVGDFLIIRAVRESNEDAGGRSVEFAGHEYAIRGRGYVHSVADLEQVVLGIRPGGVPIRVASKSVRVREVLDATLAVPGYHGILAFTLPELTLPHPRIAERSFVLTPLADIAPDRILSGQTQTIVNLLEKIPPIGRPTPTANF